MESILPARSGSIKWIFFCSLLLTVAFSLWMRNFLSPLQSGDIVEFEMAKTPERAAAILEEWQVNGKLPMAMRSIYADYFFIILYTITLSSGSLFFSRICRNTLFRQTGKFFSILAVAAGVFDLVENLLMTRSIAGEISVYVVDVTYKMAISKFSVILTTIFFIAICIVSWLANKGERRTADLRELAASSDSIE
jgi:hypothetical protein